jgi:hypothetical protein
MNHPYETYENTTLWETIKVAIDQLEKNNDIELTTNENYVIGFLCKCIDEKGLIHSEN